MSTERYINSSQQRLIKVILALFSDVVQGVAPAALAKAAGCDPSNITRDLANLQHAGLAHKDETTGLWSLTPLLPRQALKVWAAIDRAEQRLQQAKQRFHTHSD